LKFTEKFATSIDLESRFEDGGINFRRNAVLFVSFYKGYTLEDSRHVAVTANVSAPPVLQHCGNFFFGDTQ
jgi:hypothetical protein